MRRPHRRRLPCPMLLLTQALGGGKLLGCGRRRRRIEFAMIAL